MEKKKKSSSKMSRAELMAKRKETIKKGSGNKSYNYFIFKEGVHRMRPLPIPEDEEFALECTFIWVSQDEGGFISPITFSEPCAWMEKYNELKASKDEDDNKLAEKMKPKRRYLMMHIKYKDEKGKEVDEENGAKLALLTNGQYGDLCDLFLDEEQGDFSDPVNGYDIKYRRTGKGQMDTEYSLTPCKPSRLPKKYNKVYDLRAEVESIIPSYEDTEEFVTKFLKVAPDSKKKKSSKGEEVKKKKKKIRRDV